MRRAAQQFRHGFASLDLPLLEDAAAIQAGLQQVLQALADERIDARRGGLLLYGLQIASSNLKRHQRIMQPLDEPACLQLPTGESSFMDEPSEESQPETPSADYIAYRKAFRRVLQLGDDLREKRSCGAPLPKHVERRDQAALDEAFLEMKVLEARVKQEREQVSMKAAAQAKVDREMAEERAALARAHAETTVTRESSVASPEPANRDSQAVNPSGANPISESKPVAKKAPQRATLKANVAPIARRQK
jgi:hypothetical protein